MIVVSSFPSVFSFLLCLCETLRTKCRVIQCHVQLSLPPLGSPEAVLSFYFEITEYEVSYLHAIPQEKG